MSRLHYFFTDIIAKRHHITSHHTVPHNSCIKTAQEIYNVWVHILYHDAFGAQLLLHSCCNQLNTNSTAKWIYWKRSKAKQHRKTSSLSVSEIENKRIYWIILRNVWVIFNESLIFIYSLAYQECFTVAIE